MRRLRRDDLWRELMSTQKTQMIRVVMDDGSAITGRCSHYTNDAILRSVLVKAPSAKWVPAPELQHIFITGRDGETERFPGPAILIVDGIRRIEFLGSGEVG